MSDLQPPLEFGNVEPVEIQVEMERSFLEYSMSVIMARALPDARDGLKPVHRRILYSMFEQGVRPDRSTVKCSRVVGDVVGKYHPHAPEAVYDALARMAQDFSLRHLLVDGHGNFGSPHDPPGAMRYCVTGDTRVRTTAGTHRIDELAQLEPDSDEAIELKLVDRLGNPVLASRLFHSGTHATRRVTTRDGYEITGSLNHPLLCLENPAGVPMLLWKRIDEITQGTIVVMSRATHADESLLSEAEYQAAVAAGQASQKCVPSFVWEGSPDVKRAFLQALYEGDGSVSLTTKNTISVWYSTKSQALAADVQRLLLEFGVVSCLDRRPNGELRVMVRNRRNVRIFAAHVGFLGTKQARLLDRLDTVPLTSRALSQDRVPFIADYIREEAGRGGLEWLKKRNIDRFERWERDGEVIASKIRSSEVRRVIEPLVEPRYYYATVASVDDAGHQPVYSLRVDSDDHSFVTNGFVSHNTECRLAPLAMQMLSGIDEDTVDLVANYDGKEREPWVLPARFPNLLVNGSQGIAVGMATNIPPHNLGEVIDATVHMIDNPEATSDDLMAFVKGPDFPTGGLILGRAGILDAYRTGRGSIRMRARAEIEDTKRGPQIVVTDIPYQTSVESIAEKAADLVNARAIEGIREIRNERANRQNRLVFELKRDANAIVVLNNLYKHTPLQTSFGVNMVALLDGVPRTLNLAQMVSAYVNHQVEVITRRSQFRLRKALDRAHIVEGLIRALDMIDAIIALIRGSDDKAAAREGLMGAPFEFSEVQAEHILDMTLARLTRLGRSDLETELAKLREIIGELEAILGDPGRLRQVIKDELADVRARHAEPRRAEITFDPGDIDILDLIDDEELVVTMTHAGYIKTVAAEAFRTQGRGGRGVAGANLRDQDYVERIITTTAHAFLLFFSNRGKVYRLKAHEIPMKDRTARGTAIVNLLPLVPGERIQAVIDTRDYETSRFLFFATRKGIVKKTRFSEYDSSRRDGLIAINLREDDELVRVIQTGGEDDIFMVARSGTTVRFSEDAVRPTGRSAQGVIGMKLRAEDEVVSADVARDSADILLVTDAGYGKRTKVDRFPRKGRGTIGIRGIRITARRGYVVAAYMVALEDEILLISSGGTTVRIPVRQISSQGRDATGVKVMNLDEGQTVAAVAPVFFTED